MTSSNLKDTLPAIGVGEEQAQHAAQSFNEIIDEESFPIELSAKRRISLSGKIAIAVVVLVLCCGGVAFALNKGLLSTGQLEGASSGASAPAEVVQLKRVTSKVDGALVFFSMASRGDKVTVTGEDGRYYRAIHNGVNVLVEKEWVRLEDEQQPAERIAYVKDSALLYKTAFLIGDEVASLSSGAEVTVLDERGSWVFVETADGIVGYGLASAFLSEEEKRAEEEAASAEGESDDAWSDSYVYDNSYDYSYNNSGGDYYAPDTSPAPAPAPTPSPSPEGTDGGDIVLARYDGNLIFPFVETAWADEISSDVASKPIEGVVLSDGVSLYLAKLDRGDTVDQASVDARSGDSVGTVLVVVDGVQGTVPRSVVRLEDDPPFEHVDAFAQDGAAVFVDYQLTEEQRICAINDRLRLVDEYDENYVIEEAGKYYYIPKSQVSLTELEVPQGAEEPVPETETTADGAWDSGYYQQAYEESYIEPEPTPSQAPAAEQAPEPEWTEPVL